jgi:hypothetical protein
VIECFLNAVAQSSRKHLLTGFSCSAVAFADAWCDYNMIQQQADQKHRTATSRIQIESFFSLACADYCVHALRNMCHHSAAAVCDVLTLRTLCVCEWCALYRVENVTVNTFVACVLLPQCVHGCNIKLLLLSCQCSHRFACCTRL